MVLADVRIETERLLLRLPQAGDFERYAEMMAHPSSVHIGGPLLRHEAWRRFLQMPGAWLIQGYAMFAVVERASGRWMGHAGPWQPDGWPGPEVGYSFHPDGRGRGLATEACVAAMDYVFDVLGWDDVIHSIAPANAASQAVATRLGSRRRGPGTLPPPLDVHPVDIWGQTRDQWRANRARLAGVAAPSPGPGPGHTAS